MRRAERAVKETFELAEILDRYTVCRIAFRTQDYPYIVPMNYGYVRDGDRFMLYFHCADTGEKLRLMREDARVAFEIDGAHRVAGTGDVACSYTMEYESIIGQGLLTQVEGDEKLTGLRAVMRQVDPGRTFAFAEQAVRRVTVLRLDVETISGKRNLGNTP